MKVKNNEELRCFITAKVSIQERERLVAVADSLDIPYCRILRQLIRYIVNGHIGWLELFDKTNDVVLQEETRVSIRTKLTPELYATFVQLAEERGSTTSIVLRRLMLLYVTGKIEWKMIWLNTETQNR